MNKINLNVVVMGVMVVEVVVVTMAMVVVVVVVAVVLVVTAYVVVAAAMVVVVVVVTVVVVVAADTGSRCRGNREFKIRRLRTTTTFKHATAHDQNHVTVHFSHVVLRLR